MTLAAQHPRPIRDDMRIGTFLEIIEQSAGVTREQAERAIEATLRTVAERITLELHARAVFAALRDYVSSKEIHDVESELASEYAPLFSGVV
jgi:uncharacterized protein (DUF2267 family)